MDISKFHIPTLIGPNWGPWYEQIQLTARIINIWDPMRGNIISTTPTVTWDLLVKPTAPTSTYTATKLATYNAAKLFMGSKEFPRSRSNPGHHHECYLAMVWNITKDPRDTSSGMQPTNTLKFPMMWNSMKLYFLHKKWRKTEHSRMTHQFLNLTMSRTTWDWN